MASFPSGHVLTADEYNSFTPARAKMGADQSLTTSNTTFQNLTSLVLPVLANASYEGTLAIAAGNTGSATEDVKYAFTFPAGATLSVGQVGPDFSIAAGTAGIGTWGFSPQVASGAVAGIFGATSGVYMHEVMPFTLDVGANAGNLQVQAAQNTSGVNTIIIRLGSRITIWRVA